VQQAQDVVTPETAALHRHVSSSTKIVPVHQTDLLRDAPEVFQCIVTGAFLRRV